MKRASTKARAVDWSVTTWEGSRRAQREWWSRLTLDEILLWQESAADFARRLSPAAYRRRLTRGLPGKR
jgi:hypothetical protein